MGKILSPGNFEALTGYKRLIRLQLHGKAQRKSARKIRRPRVVSYFSRMPVDDHAAIAHPRVGLQSLISPTIGRGFIRVLTHRSRFRGYSHDLDRSQNPPIPRNKLTHGIRPIESPSDSKLGNLRLHPHFAKRRNGTKQRKEKENFSNRQTRYHLKPAKAQPSTLSSLGIRIRLESHRFRH